MTLKEFLSQVYQYGLKVALGNVLIVFTKWFVGADRIRLEYTGDSEAPEGAIKSKQTPS